MTNTEFRPTRRDFLDAMAVTVPDGKSGEVEVRRFTVSDSDAQFTMFRSMSQPGGRGFVRSGEYTALYRHGSLWMSDTPDERRDHLEFVRRCYLEDAETVLINGLGLGMVAAALLILPRVRSVEICDIDSDVFALVGPHLSRLYVEAGKELTLTMGDARTPATTFPKGRRWDAIWSDIWENLCTDNLAEMSAMARRYGQRAGFQGFWCKEELVARRRQERRRGWY
jgi:hypothetical protein